ncbi:hypothetical protein AGMMS49938_03920 [Fibrobacterales bacterium]|nr:hypothetical protein AGMMS49938_03920 [Fibrobacterales bacterium]
MINDSGVARDIDLLSEFTNYLIDNPSELEQFPEDVVLEFNSRELSKPLHELFSKVQPIRKTA